MKDDCCTYECNQGKDCPVRTCRQKAGRPADYEIWSQIRLEPTQEQLETWKAQDRSDNLSVAFLIAVILGLILAIVLIGQR